MAAVRPHVYILDDEADARQSIAAVVETLPVQPHQLSSLKEIQKMSCMERPGCLVLDHLLDHGRHGFDVLSMPQMGVPPIATVLFTGHADVSLTVRYMQLGVKSVVEKPLSPSSLVGAIEDAIDADQKLWREYQSYLELIGLYEDLTPRRKSVLSHLLNGRVNKWIARELEVSNRTVELDRAWLLKTFDANNSVVLAAKIESMRQLHMRFDSATDIPSPSSMPKRTSSDTGSIG